MAEQQPQVDSGSTKEEAGAAVPQQHKSAFVDFLQQLSSFSGDLSALTAPSFLLNGVSLLEYSVHYGDHPELMSAMAASDQPKERMLAMVKWFVGTLYGSFYERCANGSEKKPYNPILGEQFHCEWRHDPTAPSIDPFPRTKFIGEQVSHHPPVNAFHIFTERGDVLVTGFCGRKTKFKSMTVQSTQDGHATVELPGYNETATFTYPDLILRGVWSGRIFIELTGVTRITSSSGWSATVEYLPKPWFYGDYHQIKASVFPTDTPSAPAYTITGRWMEKMTYTEAGSTTAQPFLDLAAQQRPLKHIPSADAANSSALDSRRVWKRVTDALLAGDFGTASKEKTLLEEAQRARRKEREERGEEWKPHYFEWRSPTGNGPPGSAPVSPVQEQSAASATASTTTSPVKVSVTDEGSRSWGNIFSRKSGAATSSTSSIGSKKTTSSRSAAPASVSTVALDEGWVFRRELRTFE